MEHILIMDDDEEILKVVNRALTKNGYTVNTCANFEQIDMSMITQMDLIILDIMMPGMDGFTICAQIREVVDCPILFLTAKNSDADLVKGFSMGADDFIKKPFSITELRARVEAHLRREKREKNNAFCISGIRFLMQSKEAIVNSEIIPFTKSEYDICEYLALYHGQIFSKEQIYEAVFGFDKDSFHNVIVEHIKNIRAKLMIYGINPIQTVWGIGYKWVG